RAFAKHRLSRPSSFPRKRESITPAYRRLLSHEGFFNLRYKSKSIKIFKHIYRSNNSPENSYILFRKLLKLILDTQASSVIVAPSFVSSSLARNLSARS